MPRRILLRSARLLAALLAAHVAPRALLAQGADSSRAVAATGVVVGVVRAEDTGQPVADAQVDVEGVPKPRVLVAGYVTTGTEVIFNPQEKRVHAKGKRGIGLTNVDPTHAHELRFDPSTANPKGVAP